MINICGIGGFISKNLIDETDVERIKTISNNLQERGSDATGYCIVYEDFRTKIFKIPCPSIPLWDIFGDYLKDLMLGAKAVFIHTRAATQGKPEYNKNNHPWIFHNRWIGAHNGHAGSRTYYFGRMYGEGVRVVSRSYNDDNFEDHEPETDSYRYLFKPLCNELAKYSEISMSEVGDEIRRVFDSQSVYGSIWLYDSLDKILYIYKDSAPVSYAIGDNHFEFASRSEHLTLDSPIELNREILISFDLVNFSMDTIEYKKEVKKSCQQIHKVCSSSSYDEVYVIEPGGSLRRLSRVLVKIGRSYEVEYL